MIRYMNKASHNESELHRQNSLFPMPFSRYKILSNLYFTDAVRLLYTKPLSHSKGDKKAYAHRGLY